MVLSAGHKSSPDYRESLGALYSAYWYPLYAYLRRRGFDPQVSEDHVQAFFAWMIERDTIGRADQDRGRFRSYIVTSLKNFITNEHDRAQAKKRGGDQQFLSIDVTDAEGRYALEPSHDITPDKLFDRSWALATLDRAMGVLEREWIEAGKTEIFTHLRPCLAGRGVTESYRQLGEALDMSEGAVKTAVHRLRRRYGEALREEIAQTVAEEQEVEKELEHLLEALGH